jgi:two-component system, NarL family, sensor histidine kinase UhpB
VLNLKVTPESFGELLDEGIYRIVRESLSNALRHGHPTEIDISVQLETDDTVAIDVVDDGGGTKPANIPIGFGITGMQERVALLGGTISIRNRGDGKGVAVSARLPFQTPPELQVREIEEAASE